MVTLCFSCQNYTLSSSKNKVLTSPHKIHVQTFAIETITYITQTHLQIIGAQDDFHFKSEKAPIETHKNDKKFYVKIYCLSKNCIIISNRFLFLESITVKMRVSEDVIHDFVQKTVLLLRVNDQPCTFEKFCAVFCSSYTLY